MKNYSKPLSLPTSPTGDQGGVPVALIRPAEDLAQTLQVLGDSAKSLQALVREGSSVNTADSYRAALHYWSAWHRLRYGRDLTMPVPVSTILQFIADHAEHQTECGTLAHDLPSEIDKALVATKVKRLLGPFTPATVRHRLAVLSAAHESRALHNPCRSHEVQAVMARLRVAYARRGARPARKDALTRDPFEQLLATCDDSLIGLRDRALLLFGWASGGRRRSEIVHATLENTRRTGDGFLFHLTRSKTNQTGQDRADAHKPLVGRAAEALEAWLSAAQIHEGALFRRVRRGGVVGEALSAEAVRRIVRARAAQAGLSGQYSAHSLRSGFVTEAGRQGIPLPEVMALTGHASVAAAMVYHHAGGIGRTRASRLLDAPADKLEYGLDNS